MSRLIGLALIASIILTACGAEASPPRPAALNDRLIVQELGQLWSNDAAGAGGYRKVPDLTAAPSLYTTSWTLRLAAWYQLPVPALSRDKTSAWLEATLSAPSGADGLPPLERLWLAAQALAAMGRPVPEAPVTRFVAGVRAGEGYSYTPGGPASWAATQTAVEALELVHTRVDPTVAAAVAAALPAALATTALMDQDTEDTVLPLLQLADALLPASARASSASGIAGVLDRIHARSLALDVGAPFATSALVESREIARANGILWPVKDSLPRLASTPDGYMSLSRDQALPDPHLTYDAALLGAPVTTALAQTIPLTAGRLGWRANTGIIDPQTTLYALLVTHALGQVDRDGAVRRSASDWLRELGVTDLGADRLERLFFVLALAEELAVPVPAAIGERVGRLLLDFAGGRFTADPIWLIRVATLVRFQPTAEERAALVALAAREAGSGMRSAYRMRAIGMLIGSPSLVSRAAAVAGGLGFSGAFRAVSQAGVPDLLSTALGLSLLKPSRQARNRAAAAFLSPAGASILPTPLAEGNVVTPETVYLGYLALGRIHDEAGIFVE